MSHWPDVLSRRPRLTQVELYWPHLPLELEGLRLLHVGDLHTRGWGAAEEALSRLLAEPRFDLLVCTGDLCYPHRPKLFCTDHAAPEAAGRHTAGGFRLYPNVATALDVCARLFSRLPRPAVAVQGNHDPKALMERLAALGVTILANAAAVVPLPGRAPLQVVGVRCANRDRTDAAAALAQLRGGLFTIALCHYPELAEALAAGGADLVLAGHTHGGQLCLPGGRPLMTHSRTGRRYVAGLERLASTLVFTTRGAATTFLHLRLFCPAELALLTLRRGPIALSGERQAG